MLGDKGGVTSGLTCLKDFLGVIRLTENLLHVSSQQKEDGHHPHQHPGEDEAESNAPVGSRRGWSQTSQSRSSSGRRPRPHSRHQHCSSRVGDAAPCCRRGVLVVAQCSTQQAQVVEGQDQDHHAAEGDAANPPGRSRDTARGQLCCYLIFTIP